MTCECSQGALICSQRPRHSAWAHLQHSTAMPAGPAPRGPLPWLPLCSTTVYYQICSCRGDVCPSTDAAPTRAVFRAPADGSSALKARVRRTSSSTQAASNGLITYGLPAGPRERCLHACSIRLGMCRVARHEDHHAPLSSGPRTPQHTRAVSRFTPGDAGFFAAHDQSMSRARNRGRVRCGLFIVRDAAAWRH